MTLVTALEEHPAYIVQFKRLQSSNRNNERENKMKITMVGTSGSGKTVFSAGVYSVFMRKEFEGFKIYPRGDGLPGQMIGAHKFSKDFNTLAEKRWPEGTSETDLHPLDLYYQGSRIVNFDWIDYRGGLIDNPSIDLGKASDVYANIAASDAVILFADAHKLTETDDPEEAAYISGAEAVMRILNGFAINYPQTKLAFLIALSKCDAVHPKWKGKDGSYQPLIEHGIKAFQPLESTLRRETLWRGGILPVSTMGEGTVDENGNIVKFLKPLHIEHVMSFCIGGTLRHVQDDTLRNFIKRNESIEVINQKYSGFLGALRRTYQFFHKTNNELDTLKQLHQEQMHDIEALNRIRQPIERLETIAMRKVRIIT